MGFLDLNKTLEVEDGLSMLFPHRKVGILGGTFNPIHNGHIDMALKIRKEFMLDKVILMPCGNPPHKKNEADELAPKQKRMHMAALCAFENEGMEASDIEVKREGYTYTVDTMRELTKRDQDTDFYYIIGSDTLFELEMWKEFSALAGLARFVCVRREEHEALSVAAEAARLSEQYGATVLVPGYTGLDVSSSYIRKRIAQGKSIAAFVPESVEEYINACGLYQ